MEDNQKTDVLDRLIQRMDKLLGELEILVGYLNGSIERKEQRCLSEIDKV